MYKQERFTKKKGNKLLNALKALTNCLMSKHICENMESSFYNKSYVEDFLTFLHYFHSPSNFEQIRDKKDLKQFF